MIHRLLVIPAVIATTFSCAGSSIQNVSVGPENETPLPSHAVQFVKGMAILLLPESFRDHDDWGKTKRVQSGLNVKVKGLKVHTSRRWKNARHGTWRRVTAVLVDPAEFFQLRISLLPEKNEGRTRYRIRASTRLNVHGQQQQWNLGLKLYSISAVAEADLTFVADVEFRNRLVRTDGGGKLRILPQVEAANVKMEGFRLRRISHAKGGGVRLLGESIQSVIKRRVAKESDKLADKINHKVEEKPERFEIPAGILAVFGKDLSPPEDTAAEGAVPKTLLPPKSD
ncbi:MAG: hypothetical protein GY826_38330 [Fuerstiella sp.]|nr:hypothetical protein [Fuerstiella sp.]